MTTTVDTTAGAAWRDPSSIDPTGLSAAGRIDLLAELRRQAAANAAAQLRTLAAIGHADPDHDAVCLEVAPALQISQTTAISRLKQALFATTMLPETVDALAAGELTEFHVRILVESVWARDERVARQVQDGVLGRAGEQPPGRFRMAVTKALLQADPATAEQRAALARSDRTVRHRPAADGMVEWWALLPVAESAVLDTAIDRVARETACAGDGLTAEQRRADALVQIADAVLADPSLLVRQRQAVGSVANVTVTAETLFAGADVPGEVSGHGPISADVAAALAATAAAWRILVTDEQGRLLTWSSATYEPSAAVRGFVLARDRWCTFPGCTARAERCDLDHVLEWRNGGPSASANLEPLCRRHHNAKTAEQWTVARDDATGATVWTGPTGHQWTTSPPPLPIDPPDPERRRRQTQLSL